MSVSKNRIIKNRTRKMKNIKYKPKKFKKDLIKIVFYSINIIDIRNILFTKEEEEWKDQ